jgi:hypothetical protein
MSHPRFPTDQYWPSADDGLDELDNQWWPDDDFSIPWVVSMADPLADVIGTWKRVRDAYVLQLSAYAKGIKPVMAILNEMYDEPVEPGSPRVTGTRRTKSGRIIPTVKRSSGPKVEPFKNRGRRKRRD